jgi:hypothetical protein
MRLVIAAATSFSALSGCFPLHPQLTTFFTAIEVTRTTGEPLSDVAVSARRLSSGRVKPITQGITATGRTDNAGQVTIPVTVIGSAVFDGNLELLLTYQGRQDQILIPNRIGAVGSVGTVQASVVTTTGPPPPAAVLEVANGSNPPQILVQGFVRSLFICNNSTTRSEWGIDADLEYHYLGTVAAGEVPDGFEHLDLPGCPRAALVLNTQFTVVANVPGPEGVRRTGYCVEDDTVVDCND